MPEPQQPSTPGPVLELNRVSLTFGGVRVLNGVDLAVAPGEVVALIGPNGAGKSALINCVGGVYRAEGASAIRLGGQRIEALPAHAIARRGVMRTFQGLHLVRTLSVLDNIRLGWAARFDLGLAGTLALPWRAIAAEQEARRRAEETAELCGLSGLLATPCSELPLGVLRRVDLARALVSEPRLLLLDEPASGLSHEERPLIGEMVRLARLRAGLSVLWVEHDLDLVLSEAQRAVVLHHGERIAEGDPRLASDRARIVAAYKHGRAKPA